MLKNKIIMLAILKIRTGRREEDAIEIKTIKICLNLRSIALVNMDL